LLNSIIAYCRPKQYCNFDSHAIHSIQLSMFDSKFSVIIDNQFEDTWACIPNTYDENCKCHGKFPSSRYAIV